MNYEIKKDEETSTNEQKLYINLYSTINIILRSNEPKLNKGDDLKELNKLAGKPE